MCFIKKLSHLMDLRLLVHQKSCFSISISFLTLPLLQHNIKTMTFLIILMFCATTITANNRISNHISNDIIEYNNDIDLNKNNINNNYFKIRNSPRILSYINPLNGNVNQQQQQQQQQQPKPQQPKPQYDNEKFSPSLFNYHDNGFRPIQPYGLDQNYVQNALFTPDGHFRVFEDTSIKSPTPTFEIHKKVQQQHEQQKPVTQSLITIKPTFNPNAWKVINTNNFTTIPIPTITTITTTATSTSRTTTAPSSNAEQLIKDNLNKRHVINNNIENNNSKLDKTIIHNNAIIHNNEINETIYETMKHNENETKLEIGTDLFQELINSKAAENLQSYVLNIFHDVLSKDTYELFSGARIQKKLKNTTADETANVKIDKIEQKIEKESSLTSLATIQGRSLQTKSFGQKVFSELQTFINEHYLNVNVPRAMETGRLFIFKGLKKLLWPLFIGVQIAKSILLALFLPSILGSLGKIVGKGLVQVSGFNHQSEAVNDLDFKDNSFNMMNEDNNKYTDDYSYPRPEASENHFTAHLYEKATNNMNNALSRFGFGDHKKPHTNNQNFMYMNTDSKNSGGGGGGGGGGLGITTSKNSYKDFLKVPSSSLLLSNYDPFYSPLLSRIDSVFAQLGLAKGQDSCKEKLVCLMYAHPAKYAPYSNLVSAQLSRELNELRKPTSNNEEILRFFKYMKAAKEGQDGVNCEKMYEICKEYQDSDDPVMITTYNDINKLVQARKMLR